MISPSPPLGVVLAGGTSSRMGFDKTALLIDGSTLAERAARTLGEVCNDVVVADGGLGRVAGLTSIGDGAGKGPAAGILGAATAFPGRALMVLACDLPMVPAALLAALCRCGGDWVVPRWERGLEPLAALYRPVALAALHQQAAAWKLAPKDLTDARNLTIRYFEGADLSPFGPAALVFLNLNQPEDLQHLGALRTRAGAALHPRFSGG